MKTVVLLLVLALPVSASAFDPWSKQDIAMESAWMVLHVLDWGQTLDLAAQLHGGKCATPPGSYPRSPGQV